MPVTHTYGSTHVHTLCHTCVTHSGCEAGTCSDMMVSVEVAVYLPQCELVESGEQQRGREQKRSYFATGVTVAKVENADVLKV